jgi:hypothetical protein
MDNLLQKTYKLYNMNRTEFSKHTGIAYKTLEGWETKGLSGLGESLIKALIELEETEMKHQKELEKYRDKAERFDAIQRALQPKDSEK